MTNSLPEYLFAVRAEDGSMLGHVSYAPGIFADEHQARISTMAYFTKVAKGLAHVKPLPVEGMINDLIQVKNPSSLEEVLVDLVYANDCCVRRLAELPLESHVLDAALRCPECGTTFRHVWDGSLERLVWKWRTEPGTRARHEALISSVGETMRYITKQQQARLDDDTDDGEEVPPPAPVSVRDLPDLKDLRLS